MKRLFVSVAAAAVMVAAIVPAAMAAPVDQTAPGPGWGCGGWGYGYGAQGADPSNFDYSQVPMWKTLADKLGMDANDLVKEIQGGKSVADVATEKNVSEQELIDALMAPQSDLLNQRVESGFFTQAQADSIRQAQTDHVKYMLEQKGFADGYGWGWYGMGPGMMGWGGPMGGYGYGPGGYGYGPGMMGGYYGRGMWR